MKAADLRELDADELRGRVRQWEEQLFRQNCEKHVGTLENTNLIRATRRDIARAWTVLREKEHAGS